jgi:F420H(2)-dependent quinone reductase
MWLAILGTGNGTRYTVFASKAGADGNPGCYHNLKASPDRDRRSDTRRPRRPSPSAVRRHGTTASHNASHVTRKGAAQ